MAVDPEELSLIAPENGLSMHDLIVQCPPLERNSPYMYNLIAWHHAHTSVVLATPSGERVGAVVGYCVPLTPSVWFVWQIAVRPDHRKRGLALRMLEFLVRRLYADGVSALQTTIGQLNVPSRALFTSLANKLGGTMTISPFLPAESCGPGRDAEDLVTIVWPEGGLPTPTASSPSSSTTTAAAATVATETSVASEIGAGAATSGAEL